MSALHTTLTNKTVQAWRDFAATPEFQAGLDYLRHTKAPECGGSDEIQLVKSAIGWSNYHQALRDIEEVLTEVKREERSPEEPGLAS